MGDSGLRRDPGHLGTDGDEGRPGGSHRHELHRGARVLSGAAADQLDRQPGRTGAGVGAEATALLPQQAEQQTAAAPAAAGPGRVRR